MKVAEGAEAGGGRRSKRDAVLDRAAAHLNARGVSLASLSEVAKALGLTRAALYYYVEDRDDLVFQCYRPPVKRRPAIWMPPPGRPEAGSIV